MWGCASFLMMLPTRSAITAEDLTGCDCTISPMRGYVEPQVLLRPEPFVTSAKPGTQDWGYRYSSGTTPRQKSASMSELKCSENAEAAPGQRNWLPSPL